MSLIPEIPSISNPYLLALVVGLIYGLFFCTASCLPYLAGYIAGIGAGFRRGTTVTLIFNLGRLTAYTIVGAIVAIISGVFGFLLTEKAMVPIQKYSSYAFAAVTIAIGVSLLLKTRSQGSCAQTQVDSKNLKTTKPQRRFDFGAFSLGLSRGLVLCTPLVSLMLLSVPFGAPIDSLFMAVLFGLGTTISPILLLGGATGWLLNKAPLFRKWVAIAGAGILVALGIANLITAVVTT
jgi:sulfite exporter TauE/SafE